MKEKFISSSINLIKSNNKYSNEDIEKIEYGLEGIYLTFTKLIIIIALAIIFGFFKELVIVLVLFNIIRFFAFGFHAKDSLTCLITSIILILGLTYLMINININIYIKYIIIAISLINYILFAPADTIKRPLTNIKKRKYRKIGAITILLIYSILLLYFKDKLISNMLLTSIIIEGILINPITYKIFNMPYKNYKKV